MKPTPQLPGGMLPSYMGQLDIILDKAAWVHPSIQHSLHPSPTHHSYRTGVPGNACRFSFKPRIILIWKYFVVPLQIWVKITDRWSSCTPEATVIHEVSSPLHHRDC